MLLVGLRGCESLLALLLALLSSKGRPTVLQHQFNCQALLTNSAKNQSLRQAWTAVSAVDEAKLLNLSTGNEGYDTTACSHQLLW